MPSGVALLGTKEAVGTHLTAPEGLTLLSRMDRPSPGAWLLPYSLAWSIPGKGCWLVHPFCRAGGDGGPDIFRRHQPVISSTTRVPDSSKL